MAMRLIPFLLISSICIHGSAAEVLLSGYDFSTGNGTFKRVSADGSVVTGFIRPPSVWQPQTGWTHLEEVSELFSISQLEVVSDDGRIIAGDYLDSTANVSRPFLVDRDEGIQPLEIPRQIDRTHVWGISANGAVLGVNLNGSPHRWTKDDGYRQVAPDELNGSYLGAVSADGSALVGGVNESGDVETLEAYRWTEATGFERIGALDGRPYSRAFDVSQDGSVVVGQAWINQGDARSRAFRWTRETGMVDLGTLNPRRSTTARAVSLDGSVVLGNFFTQSTGKVDAFVWDTIYGMRDLEEVLEEEHGIVFPRALHSPEPIDFSANGRVIIGRNVQSGDMSGFPSEFWAVYLDRPLVVTSGVDGDFNGNAVLDGEDLDILAKELQSERNVSLFDVNQDSLVDAGDRQFWLHELVNTYFGDANLDGEFSSGDLVEVFRAGQYEDGIELNSRWSTGDWDGDGDFTSSDLVFAFQDGGYEQGPRLPAAVPEPTTAGVLTWILLGFLGSHAMRRNG